MAKIKEEYIVLRVAASEKKMFKKHAEKMGLNLSAMFRFLALNDIKKQKEEESK